MMKKYIKKLNIKFRALWAKHGIFSIVIFISIVWFLVVGIEGITSLMILNLESLIYMLTFVIKKIIYYLRRTLFNQRFRKRFYGQIKHIWQIKKIKRLKSWLKRKGRHYWLCWKLAIPTIILVISIMFIILVFILIGVTAWYWYISVTRTTWILVLIAWLIVIIILIINRDAIVGFWNYWIVDKFRRRRLIYVCRRWIRRFLFVFTVVMFTYIHLKLFLSPTIRKDCWDPICIIISWCIWIGFTCYAFTYRYRLMRITGLNSVSWMGRIGIIVFIISLLIAIMHWLLVKRGIVKLDYWDIAILIGWWFLIYLRRCIHPYVRRMSYSTIIWLGRIKRVLKEIWCWSFNNREFLLISIGIIIFVVLLLLITFIVFCWYDI